MSSETAPRRLVLARHAQAVGAAATDAVRELSARGRRDAAAAGRWLAELGVTPDHALVSAAVRTSQTWDQMCAGAGWELAADLDRGLYEAGTDAALDLVRLVPAQVRTLVVVGHNPTIGSLAHVLDDGDGDPEAVTALLGGYPTSALTVFAVSTAWADLAEESATVLAHHVARG
ncbi:phosphohistidine phosphatase [Nocardioides salarius]|uniref:Phosphohistidine phosphatase n=1 Tax=Nocardioides salarius TaxID=374513 RepID=A0ABS2M4S9_9ACTN|nr:histidine phosphatase family protein [Nocardioides salarius]MBM7506187.1 phosphohistidine phosphatase [Nocardioides salarius]